MLPRFPLPSLRLALRSGSIAIAHAIMVLKHGMLRKLPTKGDGEIVPGVVVLVELMPGDDEVMPGEMSPVGSHVALVALADAK